MEYHIEEKTWYRCHCLAGDGYQCECRLSKVIVDDIGEGLEFFDFERRLSENTDWQSFIGSGIK
jgi:hypothetical protein